MKRTPLKRTSALKRTRLKPTWGRIVSTLLHYANASPPHNRTEFYALKSRLVEEHGRFCGHDLQEIRKECWGPLVPFSEGGYEGERRGCQGEKCRNCGGTGVFDIRWIRLQRWEWCGRVFHSPDGETRRPPDAGSVNIFGRIEHPKYGRASHEAVLWLYLLCGEWRLFWKAMRGSCCCGWVWWPLLNVQKVVMHLTWGSGRQICRRCWNAPSWDDNQEIPF